jgi:hypothetical protein
MSRRFSPPYMHRRLLPSAMREAIKLWRKLVCEGLDLVDKIIDESKKNHVLAAEIVSLIILFVWFKDHKNPMPYFHDLGSFGEFCKIATTNEQIYEHLHMVYAELIKIDDVRAYISRSINRRSKAKKRASIFETLMSGCKLHVNVLQDLGRSDMIMPVLSALDEKRRSRGALSLARQNVIGIATPRKKPPAEKLSLANNASCKIQLFP